MTSQIFTIHATTTSGGDDRVSSALAQISGIMNMYSDLWSGNIVNQTDNLGTGVFRIPRGCDFKIWQNTVYGAPALVSVQSCSDGSGSVWNSVAADSNPTMGGDVEVKRSGRPIVIRSNDGNKMVRFTYAAVLSGNFVSASGTIQNSNVFADYTVEIVEVNSY
jgi:hypothetical protein